MIGGFLVTEFRAIIRGHRDHLGIWARQALGVAAILIWLVAICGMPVWLYLVAFVYPGAALMRLRSFAEHRWAAEASHRTAVVEASWPFGLLFLNNNLHALHHAKRPSPGTTCPMPTSAKEAASPSATAALSTKAIATWRVTSSSAPTTIRASGSQTMVSA